MKLMAWIIVVFLFNLVISNPFDQQKLRDELAVNMKEKMDEITLSTFKINVKNLGACIMKNITLHVDDRSFDTIKVDGEEKGSDNNFTTQNFNVYGTSIVKFTKVDMVHILKCRIAIRDIEFFGRIRVSTEHKFAVTLDLLNIKINEEKIELEFSGDPLSQYADADKEPFQHKIAIKLKNDLEDTITQSVVDLRKSIRNIIPDRSAKYNDPRYKKIMANLPNKDL